MTVVWAIGDACPRCSVLLRRQARHAVRRHGGTDGSVLRTVVGSARAASAVVPAPRRLTFIRDAAEVEQLHDRRVIARRPP